MRRRNVILILPALLLAAATARADEWNKKYTVSGRPDVRVETNDGNVRIEAWDGKEIQAHVETLGWKIGQSEVRVIESQTGDRVSLDVRVPRLNWSLGRRSLKIELKIPHEATLDVKTGDGNIVLHGVKGELRLTTGDGNIEAGGLDGRLGASTGDGNMRVDGRFDLLDLHTGDGNIVTRAQAGSKMAGNWTLRTGDGNLTLRVPDGFQADLDAHTGDGHIQVGFPVTVSGSLGGNTLRGKLNGGGATLTLRTGDGAISVEKY